MTTRDIETRKAEHKRSFNNSKLRMYDFKLYQAMRRYGFDNFEFSVIEECRNEELKDKERYYISAYDTVVNGYNEALGGVGKPLWTTKHIDAFRVLYENGWLLQDIARIFSSNPKTIGKKLKQYYGIDTKQNSNAYNSKPVTGKRQDETINFKSSTDAAIYLINNKIANNNNLSSVASKIRAVVGNPSRTAYGFTWVNNQT